MALRPLSSFSKVAIDRSAIILITYDYENQSFFVFRTGYPNCLSNERENWSGIQIFQKWYGFSNYVFGLFNDRISDQAR
jgi:hypothetical protein